MESPQPPERSPAVYRDRNVALALELEEARENLTTEFRSQRWLKRRELLAKRYARIAAGGVGEVAGAVMLLCGLVVGARGWFGDRFFSFSFDELPLLSWWLLGALVAVPCTYLISLFLARWRFASFERVAGREPSDPERALDWFRTRSAQRRLLRRLSRLEQPALMRPLGATALLGPLAVHAIVFAVYRLFSGMQMAGAMADFSFWIAASSLIVGHAHLVSRWLLHDAAKRQLGVDLAVPARHPVGRVVGWTALAGAIPGVLLLALPPLLTALTALVVAYPAHRWLRHRVQQERALLPARKGQPEAAATPTQGQASAEEPAADGLRIAEDQLGAATALHAVAEERTEALAREELAEDEAAEQAAAGEQTVASAGSS